MESSPQGQFPGVSNCSHLAFPLRCSLFLCCHHSSHVKDASIEVPPALELDADLHLYKVSQSFTLDSKI